MSDEESTHEIDFDGLRASLAATRNSGTPSQAEPAESAPASTPILVDVDIDDDVELADVDDVMDDESSDEHRHALAALKALESEPAVPVSSSSGRLPPSSRPSRPSPYVPPPADPAPSLIGTLPGHDVAQALRAMMGQVPDEPPPSEDPASDRLDQTVLAPYNRARGPSTSGDEVDTQTRLPEGAVPDGGDRTVMRAPLALDRTNEQEALPAFSLDLGDDDSGFPTTPMRPLMETPVTFSAAETIRQPSETTAVLAGESLGTLARATLSETTAVFHGPLPSAARRDRDGDADDVPPIASTRPSLETESDPLETLALSAEDPSVAPLGSPILSSDGSEPDGALPRFTLASIPEMPETAEVFEPAFGGHEGELGPSTERPLSADGEPVTILSSEAPPTFLLTQETPAAEMPVPPIDEAPPPSLTGSHTAEYALEPPAHDSVSIEVDIALSPSPSSVDITSFDEPAASSAKSPSISEPAFEVEPEEAEIVEVLEDEVAQPTATMPPKRALSFTPPAIKGPEVTPAYAENADAEVRELVEDKRWGPLIAVFRQRLGYTDGPNKQAGLLLKIASVYEFGLEDPNEAFETVAEALELAPMNEEVVVAVDRIGKKTERVGELADRVKKKMIPGAPDDKRVAFLAHLVFWYERVLGRGNEVSSFVSDIERHDRVHPVVLKRAAQIAAMNEDTKTQREHLLRALERTIRREEKVVLYLALANAYAGTSDVSRWYEAALEADPTCLPAIQAMKRLGKEKENYAQVQWALERQVDVAPTENERIDALLELAEIQESKFLKREAAAELLERVLVLEPAQPAALKALERCYHALRDWSALSRILATRSEHTFDAKLKVELLERAAEVYESKLGDIASAVETYRNILVVEPKHRRSLGDLARLYEKLGDWGNFATYKARLAEIAPSKRTSSQELVKLGDFLNTPERDPIAARLQYERAVAVDPTNAVGWEALQKLAAAAGDDRRVIECLEQRKKHTDVPRQRAVVLVELANVHLAAHDLDAARKCFEAAIRADSSNEAAAIAMLDAYTAEERWAEAAPLCELLVNAAIRDRDGEALFVRLRLATRIAAALGDAERAVTSAIAALEARPKDLGAQADLIAVCSQAGVALQRAREPVLRIAEDFEELPGELLIRLGGLLKDLGDYDGAVRIFLRARDLEPEAKEIVRALADIYIAQADWPRACKLKVDMARNAPTADERFELFVEAGEIWARRADELEKAASVFEEARAIKPQDPWLLGTLVWLYGELGDWATLSTVLGELAEAQPTPGEKIEVVLRLADLYRDKLGDLLRAADLYDQVIDIDRDRLDVFEELVRTLTEAKAWERLERSYRKMIARVKDQDQPQLQFALFHQLGLIYRDRLGDSSRAYDALDAASRMHPDDPEIRKIVIELLIVTDNLENAVSRLRSSIDRDPLDAELYVELYDIFLRQHAFDKAWCVVNVLSRLREPSHEQRRFHEDYSPMPLDRVPGQIVEQAWRSHVFHADLDPALTSLFALMTPAVARMRFGQLRPEQRVGRPFTPTHSRMHDAIRTSFGNAAEILSLPAPELLLADPKAPTPFAPALAPFGSILVCVPQVEPQASALTYLVGKRLAEQRPELAARAFFPTVADLSSLLGTAIRVSRNEGAKDAASAALDASFAAILTPQERDGIRSIVLQATSEGASLDVKRWSQLADLSSMRAGLLLAGDIEQARDAIAAEPQNASDLPQEERLAELLKFAVSDLHSDLRGAIGVAVQS